MKLFRELFFKNLLFLAQSFLLVLSQDDKFDFCSITCNGKKHTMCQYPEQQPAECSSFTSGIEHTMKMTLLDVHNDLRQQVAMGKGNAGLPQGANIVKLEWNDEAQKIAQRWADQCTEGEQQDECRSLSNSQAGSQNIVVRGINKDYDLYQFQKNTVKEWFESGAKFKVDSIDSYKSDPATDPFVRIIWALSSKIGCGFSHGKNNDSQVYRLVCNYYPGPVEGQPVYVKGKPCTKCPNARCGANIYPALCVAPTDSVYNRNSSAVSPLLSDSYYAVPFVSSILVYIWGETGWFIK